MPFNPQKSKGFDFFGLSLFLIKLKLLNSMFLELFLPYLFKTTFFLFANCPQAASMSFPLLLRTFTTNLHLSSK